MKGLGFRDVLLVSKLGFSKVKGLGFLSFRDLLIGDDVYGVLDLWLREGRAFFVLVMHVQVARRPPKLS